MPAALPGSTAVQNAANPALGRPVIFSSFSGPKGSPLDAKRADYADPMSMTRVADPSNISTGALSTGIGLALNDFDGFANNQPGRVLPDQNFTDDATVGVTLPSGVAATDSRLVAIGGGKSTATDVETTPDGSAPTVPYTAGFGLLGAGNGGSRDAGAGPAFTGFEMKMVTATGAVAVGAAVETGWLNRTSFALNAGKSVIGSAVAASAAPA